MVDVWIAAVGETHDDDPRQERFFTEHWRAERFVEAFLGDSPPDWETDDGGTARTQVADRWGRVQCVPATDLQVIEAPTPS